MKKVFLFGMIIALIFTGGFTPVKNINPKVQMGSYFATLDQPFIIIRNVLDQKSYHEKVGQTYLDYDQAFYLKHDLVIATVYRGSSRVTNELKDYKIKNGVLTLNIYRTSPLVQTMDYVTQVIYLAIDKKEHAKLVHVNAFT